MHNAVALLYCSKEKVYSKLKEKPKKGENTSMNNKSEIVCKRARGAAESLIRSYKLYLFP